jgi:hypothetical protein
MSEKNNFFLEWDSYGKKLIKNLNKNGQKYSIHTDKSRTVSKTN